MMEAQAVLFFEAFFFVVLCFLLLTQNKAKRDFFGTITDNLIILICLSTMVLIALAARWQHIVFSGRAEQAIVFLISDILPVLAAIYLVRLVVCLVRDFRPSINGETRRPEKAES